MTDDQKKFLEELTERMTDQGNRMTQHPLFYVYQKKDQWVHDEDNWDKLQWFDDYGCSLTEEFTDKDDNEWKWDIETMKWRCEALDKEYDADEFEMEMTTELRRVYTKSVDEIVEDVGPFFTEEAAQQHIDQNHYHYKEPFIYVNSAWRNFEMQRVMQLLFELAGKKVPSQYT